MSVNGNASEEVSIVRATRKPRKRKNWDTLQLYLIWPLFWTKGVLITMVSCKVFKDFMWFELNCHIKKPSSIYPGLIIIYRDIIWYALKRFFFKSCYLFFWLVLTLSIFPWAFVTAMDDSAMHSSGITIHIPFRNTK